MAAKQHGGGWKAVGYVLSKSRRAGLFNMYRALRSKNACKTCALGMGGQKGGMVNEAGRFPEVCKKSIQAMAADLQGKIEPAFFAQFSLDELRAFSPRELEAAGRITKPLIANPGDTHYRTATWDEALSHIATSIQRAAPNRSFFYFSGRSSNEAGFLLQVFARCFGTNHVNNCSFYCHQASGVGLASVTGSGTATVVLEDLDHCDLVFLIGANPSSNHPRLMRTLAEVRRRGGKVVVINPVREPGLERFKVPSDWRSMLGASQVCDVYVQPHLGGDAALLAGIAKTLIEGGSIDRAFIDQATDGWDAYRDSIADAGWGAIVEASGVAQEQIEQVADVYAKSKNAVFCWAMGVTHHANGVGTVRAIANLAMLRGMLGRPHAGLLPLRGHSNVQGIGSMGVVPRLKEEVFNGLQSHFGIELPTWDGLDTLGCIEEAEKGAFDFAMCLGGNLYGSNPDAAFAERAIANIDTVVYLSTTLNTGHVHGRGKTTIVLPVKARDEEAQSTTQESMFNYVRLSEGGPSRLAGPRSEVEVIADVAFRVLGPTHPIDWNGLKHHGRIREAIAKVVPGYAPISKIDRTNEEFQVEGRTLHEPRFPTASGRAKFFPIAIDSCQRSGFRLTTVRSEGQFNTVVYEDEDTYRGQKRRDVVLINPNDMRDLGIQDGQRVTVTSEVGTITLTARPFDVRAGNVVAYYPEANAIVPRRADSESRTPAFKSVDVSIMPA